MEGELSLHTFRRCPFAIRVRMTLAEKGISYTRIEEDLSAPSARLLEINPLGTVPVLVHGKHIIVESAVITEYLDEKFPKMRLMPQSPWERALVRMWTLWCDHQFKPDLDAYKYGPNRPEISVVERHLVQVENLLGESPFLLGKEFSLADIHLFPFFRQLARAKPEFPTLGRFKALQSWMDRISQRECFRQAMERTVTSELG